MKAIWNKTIIAESNETKVVENNHYFPQESINLNILNQVIPPLDVLGKEKPHITM